MTNNKTATVRKNDGRNGGKPGQGNRGNDRRQQQDFQPKQAGPRVDFKARAAALKAEQNAEYARSSEERLQTIASCQEALARLINARSQRKSLKKLLLAEQTQPVVTVAL